jgi:alpha-glucosidase
MAGITLVSLVFLHWTWWTWPGLAQVVDSSSTSVQTQTTTAFRPIFTVPSEFSEGEKVLPNIKDPKAVDAQAVCPGYKASGVTETENGFTAYLDLAGPACNVYGNDVEALVLTVEYQASDRLLIQIQPRYIGPENETWFILPEALVPKPASPRVRLSQQDAALDISWTNDPTFSFSVTRKATSDVLFSTKGSVLVYEDQFIEFVSSLPENYNLYGLGEVIHGFRLGNNLTSEGRVCR